MEQNESYIAVISGDIVKSTKLSTEEYSNLVKRIVVLATIAAHAVGGVSIQGVFEQSLSF